MGDGPWSVNEIMPNTHIQRPSGALVSNPAGYFANTNSHLTGFALWKPSGNGTAAPLAGEWSQAPDDFNGVHIFIWIDHAGTIWRTAYANGDYTHLFIQKIPSSGFDINGNPEWFWANATQEAAPAMFIAHAESPWSFRALYDSDNDVMILCGYTAENDFLYGNGQNNGDMWGMAGKVFVIYDNWEGINGDRRIRLTIVPPLVKPIWEIRSLDFDGDVLALGYTTPADVRLYNMRTGAYLGTAVSNGATGSNGSYIDQAHAVKIRALASGDYRIIAEREIGGSCLLYNASPAGSTTSSALIFGIPGTSTTVKIHGSTIQTSTSGIFFNAAINNLGNMPMPTSHQSIRDIHVSDGSTFRLIGGVLGYKGVGGNSFSQISLTPVGPPVGFVAWLKADDGPINSSGTPCVNGAHVANWIDQSTSGNNATVRRGTPTFVTNAINGLPCIHQTTSDELQIVANFAAPVSIFYVSKMTAAGGRVMSGIVNNWLLGYWQGNRDAMYAGGFVKSPTLADDTATHLYSVVQTGSLTSFYGNGTLIASNANGLYGPDGIGTNGGSQAGETSDVYIGEILVYPSALSDEVREEVESYLLNKWGI